MSSRLLSFARTRATRGLAVSILVVSTLAGAIGPARAALPSWKVVGTAAGAAYGHLSSVSCPSTTFCFAVGTQVTPSSANRLIEGWNGSKWTAFVSPVPAGALTSHLSAVQCISAANCTAVGQYNTALSTKTLAVHWDGTKWAIVPSANAPVSPVSLLSGLRCARGEGCFAVGGWFAGTETSSAESTLIEKWDGTTFSIVPSPNATDAADSVLNSVACASSTSCFAVGSYDTTIVTNTLVEQWDGTTWSVVSSPSPASSNDNELLGVACPTLSGCIAVGSGHGTLVETWDGASWSIVTSPTPTGATGAGLTGVSCPSVLRCFAVGQTLRKAIQQRLVLRITPQSRSIVNVPVPSGTRVSSLSGVSSATIVSCFAVGDFRLGPTPRPLLEWYS